MNRFDVRINVAIHPAPDNTGMVRGYGQLEISETVTVQAETFLELCEVLAQFDKLAKTLGVERGRK